MQCIYDSRYNYKYYDTGSKGIIKMLIFCKKIKIVKKKEYIVVWLFLDDWSYTLLLFDKYSMIFEICSMENLLFWLVIEQ